MNKRNLVGDLALCDAATPGPWDFEKGKRERNDPRPAVLTNFNKEFCEWYIHADFATKVDARFTAEAREGWPEAIRRAIAAEEEVERLSLKLQSALYELNRASNELRDASFEGHFKNSNFEGDDLAYALEKAIQRIQEG